MGAKVSQRQLKAAQGLTRALGRESIPTESESWEEVMEAVDTLNCDAEDLARLTRELDEARRAAHDTAPLRARAEQAEAEVEDSEEAWRQESIRRKQAEAERDEAREQLRLANIDATTNEAEANDLRAERDRLIAKCREMGWPEDAIRAALRGEEGSP